jgi:mannose-6-phosphate isomerase-like protein (cupin superfamily)
MPTWIPLPLKRFAETPEANRVKLFLVLVATAFISASSSAQSPAAAQVYSGKDIAAQLEALSRAAAASGSSGATLGDFSSHAIKLSVRTSSGGAEVHAHFDDIFFVTGGSATLITGGRVLQPQTSLDGETKGSAIEGGTRQVLHEGDVVHIPAGMPHQLLISPGETYRSIVVKVKE